MIIEDYVNFETAKLLKEKGFDEICMYVYRCNGSEDIQKPTLQMVMKWLRNKHKMFVLIEYSTFDFDANRPFLWSIREMKIDGGLICGSYYSSYEKACEAAIKYALENLI